jgi:hypothetical protein
MQERTHTASLGHTGPRRRHQPLHDLQVSSLTRKQKRSVAQLHTNTTRTSASASHTATQRHSTYLAPLRHCIRPRRRHQPLCDLQVSSLTRYQERSVAALHTVTVHASASASHTATQPHSCTYPAPLRRCIRPRRRHQPLCDLQVSSLTRTQKRSEAPLHASTTHTSASASHTATQRHCTHPVPLRHCIRPRRRHQPLCDLQAPIPTCHQKRSVAILHETYQRHKRQPEHHKQSPCRCLMKWVPSEESRQHAHFTS